ncbi:MAG TPA: CBS domain-containing protein [Pirellulales bacterium]|nr:CBS domain-containing protein [Pirellulales bacterium]
MNSAIERLLTLRVSDVMSRNVVSVAANKSMAEAATVLTQQFISGAPVVGNHNQCVGILSAIDFVRSIANASGASANPAAANGHACQIPATDLVASHMSALVQTVAIDQPLTAAARLMCQNHIHRLIALDDQGRPAGVLTSLDIVAALISALEE